MRPVGTPPAHKRSAPPARLKTPSSRTVVDFSLEKKCSRQTVRVARAPSPACRQQLKPPGAEGMRENSSPGNHVRRSTTESSPGGANQLSPALQSWESGRNDLSPGGTPRAVDNTQVIETIRT